MTDKVIAVEVGGSKFITGVLEKGRRKVYGERTVKIEHDDSECLLEDIVKSLEISIDTSSFPIKDIDGIGVVSAGKWSSDRTRVNPPNLPFEHREWLPLGRKVASSFELPVFTGNDVNAGVLAEKMFGAGKVFEGRYIGYLTISSGIGFGIYDMKHDEIFSGEHGQAPEIGHNKLVDTGFRCGCGGKGHWEAYGSGNGLENIYNSMTGERKDAKSILEEADENERCEKAVSLMAYYNAVGLGQIINSFQPGLIVFGGSPVFYHKEKVFGKIMELLEDSGNEFTFISKDNLPRMKVSELGGKNILFGAGALAFLGDVSSKVHI